MTIEVATKTFSTIIGTQSSGKLCFKELVVIQNDALVFFANSVYFFEWKKVISPSIALTKSFISKTFLSK